MIPEHKEDHAEDARHIGSYVREGQRLVDWLSMSRKRVGLTESIKSTFENANATTSNPFTDVVVCVSLGVWWWITGMPETSTSKPD